MTKAVVVSAPRSGTHMLVRMIARAAQAKWAVAVGPEHLSTITESSWVVGCHAPLDQVRESVEDQVRIVCIWREPMTHAESLQRFGLPGREAYLSVLNSMEPLVSVSYSALVRGDRDALLKVESLCGITGVKPEPLDSRYQNADLRWRIP